jgi:hypothetical protein
MMLSRENVKSTAQLPHEGQHDFGRYAGRDEVGFDFPTCDERLTTGFTRRPSAAGDPERYADERTTDSAV